MNENTDISALRAKRTILVVEDNDMNREMLVALLEDEYDVLEAENGLTGLEQLENFHDKISLVLLDVYMPGCDGFEFLERKQQDPAFDSVPVIMMTASNTVEDEIRCLELGASDFITKPYNVGVMLNRIKGIIRMRESAAMLNRMELDGLTGLYSKEFFFHNVEQILRADRETAYDIVCSNIENFRAMNERYGRPYCDRFLRSFAKDIGNRLPDMVLGGRIGSEEFAFLIRHQDGKDWAGELSPNKMEDNGPKFNTKFGIFANVDHDLPAEALCDRATLALGQIKRKFNVHVSWYDEEMRQMQLRKHEIEENMQTALEERQFVVYYQPKHNLHTDRTGGAEALVRWIHPELGFISPGTFIPLFERNGFVTQLDFYIWEEVCQELHRCVTLGLPAVPVSINVSRMDFDVPDLAGEIARLADRYEVAHSLLHIELTESMYSDNPGIARTLEELHENGFIIELDDFGAGYSSLTSLNTLRLDVMKLDMSMIRHASATNDYSILRFATLLADGMRLKTVVEGVETEDQVAALRVLGCDYIQGYYYSKPLPAAEFEQYIAAHGAV